MKSLLSAFVYSKWCSPIHNVCKGQSDQQNCLLLLLHSCWSCCIAWSLTLMCPSHQHQQHQQRDRPPCIRTPSRDPFRRPPHRPLYPYSQEEIDLPPSISLSDGEEPPPYQGPCTMQLRPPEQQQEINRESVRAPPNRTVYDSDYLLATGPAGPCPPSSHAGVSATVRQVQGRLDGPPPPSYNEVFGTRRPVSDHGDSAVVHTSGSMPSELSRFCYKAV
uniref:Uncharacterized protein n=1 Tax=Eptatretus burgeri TaxID=7764 RepID=A0A8C4N358_EPTBU